MKSILILGANSDIAVAIARKFGAQGFKLVLASRHLDKLDYLQRDLSIKFNVPVQKVFFDALDYNSHKTFLDKMEEVPDVTVCAFGYLGDQQKAQLKWEESEKIIQTNFNGAVSILNCIANVYEESGKGVIVGISSVAGDRGRQSNYIYGSAKAGFSAYLSGMRNRLAKSGAHVITVKPGFVDTKMTEGLALPALLTAKPDEVANRIFTAVAKRQNEIYVLRIWGLIMLIIKLIPEFIFKKMNL